MVEEDEWRPSSRDPWASLVRWTLNLLADGTVLRTQEGGVSGPVRSCKEDNASLFSRSHTFLHNLSACLHYVYGQNC